MMTARLAPVVDVLARNVTRLALIVLLLPLPGLAAELAVADGVVVKFGAEAQLVVRDRFVPGKGIVLTSQKDDSAGGQTGPSSQSARLGDWRGVRLEQSASTYGALTVNDLTIRYAGALDGSDPEAALTVRGWSPTLQH